MFTGAGSYASGKWGVASTSKLKRVLLFAVIVVLALAVITPAIFRACLGFGLFFRIAIALLLIAPLGFVLGMPFPLGLPGGNAAFFRFGSLGVGRQWILHCDWHGAGADAWNDGWFPNGVAPRVWVLPHWAARDKKDFRQDGRRGR
jgi:hypothetical protein